MSAFSTEELREQIAAGRYAVDSGTLAEEILTKVVTVRRVRRMLMSEGEERATVETGQATPRRSRRGARAETARSRPPRTERLS
jgi:hypothetical protein